MVDNNDYDVTATVSVVKYVHECTEIHAFVKY